MNRKIISVLFAAFFLCLLPNISATEYSKTDGNGFLLFPLTAFSTPLDPKVACEPNNNNCLMLVYENNSYFGQGVKLWYSTDNFKSVWFRSQVGSYAIDLSYPAQSTANGYNLHYPYDVIYDPAILKYKIVIGNQKYYYSIGSGLINNGTINTGTNSFSALYGIGFINATNFVALATERITLNCYQKSFIVDWNTNTYVQLAYNSRGCSVGSSADITKVTGFVGSTGTLYRYYGSSSFNCGTCTGSGNQDINNTAGFPTSFTGLDYWVNSLFAFQKTNNETWKTTTSHFSTYTNIIKFYDWYAYFNETINHTDSDITSKNEIWAYEDNDYGSGWRGVWVYNSPITPITIWGEGCDPYIRSCENVNLSVVLNCSAQSYYTTNYGQFVELATPCQTDNVVSIIAADPYFPVSYAFSNFSIPASCWNKNVYVRPTASKGFLKAYNFTIQFKDKFFGTNIPSVTSIFNGQTLISDSSGKVSYQIFPIDSPNFIEEPFDTASCTQLLTFTGIPKPLNLIASKSGYGTLTDTFEIAASPFRIETDFVTFGTEYLEPANTRVEVFLYTQDGIELNPSRVTINVTGSNDTYFVNNKVWLHQSYGTKTPALFYLFNNTGTYNITIKLNYFGLYLQTISVTTGTYQAVQFYLNKSSWELPCYSNADCKEVLCLGQFFKDFEGCENSICKYQTIDCGSELYCDDILGCVDVLQTQNCTKNNDCAPSCSDTYTMIDSYCGDNGYCKGYYLDCLSICNVTLGYCEEYRNCVYPTSQTFKAGYNDQSGSWAGGTSAEISCSMARYDKHFCIIENPFNITENEMRIMGWTDAFKHLIVSPSGWEGFLTPNGNAQYIGWFGYDLTLKAVSGYCDKYCNLTWEYCDNGCDTNTGSCKGISAVAQPTFTGGFWELYNSWIPDITTRSILWLFYGIILIVAIWGAMMKLMPKKANIHLTITWEIFGIILLVWLMIGSFIYQFFWYVWLAVAVIAVGIVAQYASRRKGGS
jgi:hypothetical protein